MQSPAQDLNFCSAWALVACEMLAQVASHAMFDCDFESTSTKQYSTKLLTRCCKYSKNNV